MLRSTGEVTDRPWGITLAELGIERFTGILTVAADGKEYSISFDLGRVVAANSPLASDAAVRIALTNHLVSSSQAQDFNRRIAAAKDRDEMEVLAELAQLAPEVVDKLRRRLVAQRAARTFSLEHGTYAAAERIAMPPGADLDVGEVIYLGARVNLNEQRLAAALRDFGSVFVIDPDALPLDQFGFTAEERPVIDSLLRGASLPQLEVAHRDIDPRMVQAIVYALRCGGACSADRFASTAGSVAAYSDGPVLAPRTVTPTEGAYFVSRAPTSPGSSRTPGDSVDPPQLPSAVEIPMAPGSRPGRARTESGSMRAPAPPVVDDGVPRIPPGRIGRTPTESPATARTQTGDTITDTPASDPTGFRGASGEPPIPRTATPRPGTGSAAMRALGQPTIPKAPRGARPAVARTTSSEISTSRTQTSDPPTGPSPAVARTATGHPPLSRTQTSDPAVARTASGRPAVARTSTARRTQALIAARMILVEQGADYFTLLGVPFDAPTDAIQTAYLNLVRQLHPDKLAELEVPDPSGNAHRLFQQIGLAFSVLMDPTRRAAYLEKVGHPQAAIELTSRTRTADDIPATPAGDAYRRGESALRRDEPAVAVAELGRACALEPNNVDFHAMLGWAQFCAARDKETIAPETRKALERAIQRSTKPTHARFLLGRVERMLGRDREALRHFHEVLEVTPNHPEAAAEIRAIDARIARANKR